MSESKDFMNPAEAGMCPHGNFAESCAQCGAAENDESKIQTKEAQKPTPEELNNMAFKKTVKEFKEVLKPKSMIKGLKDFWLK